MMAHLQLDLFYESTEIDLLNERINDITIKNEKVKKKLQAENRQLSKLYIDAINRLEIVEREINLIRKNK